MQLKEVKTTKEVNAFHKLPSNIYKNDPNYIAHIKQDIDKVFDPNRNKLFKQGGEAIRWFYIMMRGIVLEELQLLLIQRQERTAKTSDRLVEWAFLKV